MNARTGEQVYRERLETGGGRPFYASPVLCEGRLFVPSRSDGVYVLEARPGFKLLARNRLSDETDFNASVAIANGQLILRSSQTVYCVRKL
ncbi:MAG: PQQ-binding-like beta-propeller repeat protein [Planctomycetaceae bacterium]